MRPEQLRTARQQAQLTQIQAAARLGVSQPYLSQLERGLRPMTVEITRRAAVLWQLPPSVLPLAAPESEPASAYTAIRHARQFAALGYPGFAHLAGDDMANPAAALLAALRQPDLDVRTSEALPWVAAHHADLDWSWLIAQAKLHDIQNRLGFIVALAAQLAERSGLAAAQATLGAVARQLEPSRLARDVTLCRESMPSPERRWLASTRSTLAQHWNVLTGLTLEQLAHD